LHSQADWMRSGCLAWQSTLTSGGGILYGDDDDDVKTIGCNVVT